MTAQYDNIAEQYSEGKESPLRRHVEAHTFFGLLGDVCGLGVLDLACGDGFYTRQIAAANADRVVGVDISEQMIRLAREKEASAPVGIQYHCEDVALLSDRGLFDVATGVYLLHYAPTAAALSEMCTRIASQLKPGGRLVCINENPDQSVKGCAGYSQYGFNKTVQQPREDGSQISYAMVSGRQMIRFHAYYYSRETYQRCLSNAGFREISWLPLTLSPKGIAECGEEYWQEYLANPPVSGLVCRL